MSNGMRVMVGDIGFWMRDPNYHQDPDEKLITMPRPRSSQDQDSRPIKTKTKTQDQEVRVRVKG